uniref:Uncharacterized protein n=1 Tax=Arundo donax TaxID=35708 RepID=A0A0A8YCY0_ARUDO
MCLCNANVSKSMRATDRGKERFIDLNVSASVGQLAFVSLTPQMEREPIECQMFVH